jgi:two-component system, sensor histidine kinase and response regulator
MRILYIEDNPANVALIDRVIQMSGDELETYSNAEDALARTDMDTYDLIITDIHLGENAMDGLDFTELLRQNGVHIPIVAITAYDFDEYEQRSEKVGSNVYLVKPVSPRDIVKLLDKFRT